MTKKGYSIGSTYCNYQVLQSAFPITYREIRILQLFQIHLHIFKITRSFLSNFLHILYIYISLLCQHSLRKGLRVARQKILLMQKTRQSRVIDRTFQSSYARQCSVYHAIFHEYLPILIISVSIFTLHPVKDNEIHYWNQQL